MIKVSVHQEDITIINICAPNTQATKYIKQIITNLKGKIDNNTIIIGEFNTPLSAMGRSSRGKNQQEILELNHT